MGRLYTDDHRVILYSGAAAGTDITDAVGDLEARDELDALSVELTFRALRNQMRDPGMPWCGARPGDKLRVVNRGAEVFSGVILRVGLDGSITANDPGWYLTKSEIVYQCDRAAAPDAVRGLCAKAGIQAGQIDLPPTRISQAWIGETPEDILRDILEICAAETGRSYRRRVTAGALSVGLLPEEPITAWHKPADNLPAVDITWAKGAVSGEDSMEDLRNSVVLTDGTGDGARVLGTARNAASIARYGLLQSVESLSKDETTAQARQRVRNLLADADRITADRTVDEILGADEVTSGVVLRFADNKYGVTGRQRVTSVVHKYGHPHTMSLTLRALDVPRAAGSGDTITV